LALFDHLVGAAEQLCWHLETEGVGSLKVDHQLELDRGLDGKIARLFALQYAIGIVAARRKLSVRSSP